jgi:hypothetical protein
MSNFCRQEWARYMQQEKEKSDAWLREVALMLFVALIGLMLTYVVIKWNG